MNLLFCGQDPSLIKNIDIIDFQVVFFIITFLITPCDAGIPKIRRIEERFCYGQLILHDFITLSGHQPI